ncbi:hypothetical protein FRC12_007069 [Ceratobasidium sp. 428]|nr:hypothetical protein FRC12_007069 [Ceratobasidium sp. 428]
MYFVTLFSVALATTSAFALDPVDVRDDHVVQVDSLPITANFKLPDGVTLPEHDRARFKALLARGGDQQLATREMKNVKLKNTAVHYTMSVGVGSPATYCKFSMDQSEMHLAEIGFCGVDDLLLDSGSGYTWLGAGKKYVKTKSSFKQKETFYVNYQSGSAVGQNYKDNFTLSPSLSISNKSFGVASSVNGVEGFDGILGLGPNTLSQVLEVGDSKKSAPTILDALFAQKKIPKNMFGLSFAPTKKAGTVDGQVTFGGVNSAKYTGKLNWVDVTKKEPFNMYWGYEQSIKYGNQTIQKTGAGVVDTGTTLIYITPNAFKIYSDSLPGSKMDEKIHLLEIPKESVGKMKSLFFNIGGVSYEFTPNAQLWPRSLNAAIGGKADSYYSVISAISDLEADTGSSFVNGYAFLQRFYTAYDQSKHRIGFATTPSTYANVN